jgi:protein O-GlcNAc transferase
MPDCYFVNSHSFCAQNTLINDEAEYDSLRAQYSLPAHGFVFCSHNRPDKIDCTIFDVWLEALVEIRKGADRNAVLWMLRSGAEMEKNLRRQARKEFGLSDDALVFCDVAPREDHLRRLGCADVFLDTPSYNAHTVGCDALFAGVPMISLLRPEGAQNVDGDPCFVATEKLASRVGASLLASVDLEEFVVSDLTGYKNLMIKCAAEQLWFRQRAQQLSNNRFSSPLFDTQRWVENLDAALRHLVLNDEKENDVLIEEAEV